MRHEQLAAVLARGCQCRWIENQPDAEALCCGALTDGGSWSQRPSVRDDKGRLGLNVWFKAPGGGLMSTLLEPLLPNKRRVV